MSNAISLDKRFFLGWWILSLTFFSSKISFPKQYGIKEGWGGGGMGLGLEVTVFWKGQPVGGQLTLVQFVCLFFFFLKIKHS